MKKKIEMLKEAKLAGAKAQYEQFCQMIDRTKISFNTGSKEIDNDLYAKQDTLANEKKKEAKELYDKEVKKINEQFDLMLAKLG